MINMVLKKGLENHHTPPKQSNTLLINTQHFVKTFSKKPKRILTVKEIFILLQSFKMK